MRVGDLVIRDISHDTDLFKSEHRAAVTQREALGHGVILSKQMAGRNPVHPCITVYYPKVGKIYDIAESLVEVISETG